MQIHSSAVVDSGARIGQQVEIGPYAVIEPGVTLGEGVRIGSHARICRGTTMGKECVVHPGAVLGGDPQYLGFDSDIESGVLIGDQCVFREHTTVHRSMYAGSSTRIGNRVYMMVGSHVAHDCILHDKVVLTNAALVAGHVEIGKGAYIGGAAGIHQFVRIGEGAMVAGAARITKDVAPFLMVSERDEVHGLNLVGLKRRGVDRSVIKALKEYFNVLFRTPGNIREQANQLLEGLPVNSHADLTLFLGFFEGGKRGFCGTDLKRRQVAASESED